MTSRLVKYNPSFLTDEELIDSFVVRQADLIWLLGHLREKPARHILVQGLRGTGKTTLVLRVAAEIRRDPELSKQWYPLVFSEETYTVATPGEFWLEAVSHLAEQTDNDRLRKVAGELLDQKDEGKLLECARNEILKFADSHHQRVLFIVENFNMLLDKQIKHEGAAEFRDSLMSDPRITILATSTSRFEELDGPEGAFSGVFDIRQLQPLSEEECRALWRLVAGQEPDPGRVRAIQILTGGNPRLLAIISKFGAEKSFKQLMEDLMALIDDHTEYFKSHLDNLALTERKVYLALAEIWDPATAYDVARLTRYTTSTASSYLNQLVRRGLVTVVEERARKKWYQIAERMYNIYYLMRRRGTSSSRVKALVDFMVTVYGHRQTTLLVTREACGLEPELRKDHFAAYEEIMKAPCGFLRGKLLEETPKEFFELPDLPDSIEELTLPKLVAAYPEPSFEDLIQYGNALMYQRGDFTTALAVFREAIKKNPGHPLPWVNLGMAYHELGKPAKAEASFRKSIELDPGYAKPWAMLGELLRKFPDRYHEAELALRKVIQLLPHAAIGWIQLAELHHKQTERFEEAEEAYRRALELEPENPMLLLQLGLLYEEHLGRHEEAEIVCRKVTELAPDFLPGWELLGQILFYGGSHSEEAEVALRKAIELDSDAPGPYTCLLIILLRKHGCSDVALEPLRRYLAKPAVVGKSTDEAIILLEWLAAWDCGKEVLDVIERSPSASILEPLIVGLKLFLGKEVRAAPEVLEVGEDVMKHIEEMREQLKYPSGGDDVPPEG